MKSFAAKLSETGNAFFKKLPSSNKLPFFTLSFTLAALIVTIIAVQQQQNLIQEAARREPCEDGSVATTQGPTSQVSLTTTDSPTAAITDEGAGTAISVRQNKVPGQLLVKYKKGANKKSVEDKVRKKKGRVKKRLDRNRLDVFEVPQNEEGATISEILKDPNIEYVQNDVYGYPLLTPNDSEFGKQWALHNTGQNGGTEDADIDAPEAWDVTEGSDAIKIAVIDTGIDKSHPDLKNKIIAEKEFLGTGNTNDSLGHGTHVAGIIAAIGNNSQGISGVCPKCVLLNAKIVANNNQSTLSSIVEGINWAIDNDADIINISMSHGQNVSELKPLEEAVNEAVSKGIIVVAGAGNCGGNTADKTCSQQDRVVYPGGYDSVIGVAATTNKDKRFSLSSVGEGVDVAAPGDQVISTLPGNKYGSKSGTSMASPHVAGLAGLLLSKGNSKDQVISKIYNTADEIEGSGRFWAHGRINAAKALGADGSSDPNDPDPSVSPDRTRSPKPTKPCKPAKDKPDKNNDRNNDNDEDKDGNAKPTKANNKDNEDKDKNNSGDNGGQSQNPVCRLVPNLPFCNTNRQREDCVTNPSRNTNTNRNTNSNANGGSGGRDGQENTSSNPSNVNIGDINDDETSDTTVTVNGQTIDDSGSQDFEDGDDINTGGQQGGNQKTDITINRDGQNQTNDQSGSDGNTRTNTGGNNRNATSDDCASGGNGGNNKKKENERQGNNGGNGGGILCRFFPFLGRCQNDNDKRRQEAEKRKKDEETKKKAADAKKKADEEKRRNVQGVTTQSPDRTLNDIITECMKNPPYPSDCTPDDRALADTNKDGKVTASDRNIPTP